MMNDEIYLEKRNIVNLFDQCASGLYRRPVCCVHLGHRCDVVSVFIHGTPGPNVQHSPIYTSILNNYFISCINALKHNFVSHSKYDLSFVKFQLFAVFENKIVDLFIWWTTDTHRQNVLIDHNDNLTIICLEVMVRCIVLHLTT